MKQVRETSAAKAISVYIVLDAKGRKVATIQAHHTPSAVQVDVWDETIGLQQKRSTGYGFDKFTSALAGLTIDGHVMSDHCETSQPLPKGKHVWTPAMRVPKGYSTANYITIERATGKAIGTYEWRERAQAQLPSDAPFDAVKRLATDLELQASAAGALQSGYRNCYKRPGLDYLQALGYRVIKGI